MRSRRVRWAMLAGVAILSGCAGDGGGGGAETGVVVVPGAPAPTPSPTAPPVTPSPSPTADPLEDQRSGSAVAAQAGVAYAAGFTGRGIRIAIIDTGIDPTLDEFADRIDPASRDIAGDRGLVDLSGHGTGMASIALAARDGAGMHGVAYEATLLSFNVSAVGTCDAQDCPVRSGPVARAIDAAVAARARVISMSFTADQSDDAILVAVRRAVMAGTVVVVSAGNAAGAAEPLRLSRAIAGAGGGAVIIAGAHDRSGRAWTGGNPAGSGDAAASYLAALGVDVPMLRLDGALITGAGTSQAAAAISGAVALIAQARPRLTGAQIVALLLDHATDAGESGRDPVFGNGILNIAASLGAG